MTVVDYRARLEVGGVSLCPLAEADVVARVREEWRGGRGGTIVTANVDIVRAVARDRSLAELLTGASLVVADGMPLVWAARLMGEELPERVTGSSLVFSLSEAAAADGRSIFLLGGDPGIPEEAGRALRSRFPGLQVAGTAAPPFGFEQTEHGMDEVVRAVVAATPDLVLVGLGFPKQERTIRRLREALPNAWYLGCGAGIPMAAGQFRRAPVVVQRLGMEWLYRFALEPRRLARRYLRDDLPFAVALLSGALRRRLTTPRASKVPNVLASGQPAPAEEPRPLAVVIVTYTSAEVVADCLTTLPAALVGAGPTRVVVVDNASPDETLEVVARVAPHAEIVSRAGNDGFAAGVNAGLAATAAEGCDVLVLNPDVRLAPGSVVALREAVAQPGTGIAVPRLTDAAGRLHLSLRRRPTVLRALGDALLGGTRAGRVSALGALVLDERSYERPGTSDWATGAAWLISRDCADAVGKLDERYFLYSEETEYMLRAAGQGFAVHYQPAATAVHLGGEQASSPWLWALGVTNMVRLHRERRGRAAAALMWLVMLLNETLRLAFCRSSGRRARHRAGARTLLRMRRWPAHPVGMVGSDNVGTAETDDVGYVCFSAQDWWYHNRAHSDFQLMRGIARHRRVLVVNSIGMRMPRPGRSTHTARRILRKLRSVAMLVRRPIPDLPDFYVMSPLPLPFYSTPWLRRLNAVLVRAQVRVVCLALGLRAPVIVTTLPTAWDVVRPMPRRALVFNRSDRHSEFPESDRATIESMERELLGAADHVLYVSRSLLAEERALTGERAHFLDHGVDVEHFRPLGAAELPSDLAAIPEPRVGFFGALDDYLVDFGLLERVAAELPDVSLVLIGDATHPMERFDKYPNVHWLGHRPYEQLPAYGSGFSVALMPWLDNRWIRHSNPIKLKEYLALGLPVVSTGFAEVAHYTDRVRVAVDPADFVAAVSATLADGGISTPGERRNSVLGASWRTRADTVIDLAEGRASSGREPGH